MTTYEEQQDLFLGACLLCVTTVFSQNINLQPVPQQFTVQDKNIDLPSTYLLTGEEEANPHAVKALQELLSDKQSGKNGLRIYIGEKTIRVCVNTNI